MERHERTIAGLSSSEVLASLPCFFWGADPDGGLEYASPQMLTYTGAREEELLGQGWLSRVHPDDVARASTAIDAATKSATHFDAELRFRRHDGAYRWFRNRATPVRDEAGEVVHWLGVCLDIEDVARDEHAVRYTWSVPLPRPDAPSYRLEAADLEAALGALDEAVLILDTRGHVIAMNARALRILEIESVDEWRDRPVELASRIAVRRPNGEPIPEDERPWVRTMRAELIRREEVQLVTRSGERLAALFNATPITTRDGRRLVTMTALDITDMRHAEQELRESRERLDLAIDTARVGIWDWDVQGGRIECTDRVRSMFGLLPGAETSWDVFLGVLHPDDRERVQTEVAASLEPGSTGELETDYRIVWPDGSVRWIAAHGRTHFTERGGTRSATRVLGTALDVTARKHEEELLREADERKSEFLGVLSHELRNPLAPIGSALFVLGSSPPGSEPAKKALAVMERQVAHITHLIDDLLDVTRISRGKVQLQKEWIDLGSVVARTVDDHRTVFADSGITLDFVPAKEKLPVFGDTTRLSQVVGNLLLNAAKFTERGGSVTVSVARDEGDEGRAAIRVRDTGVGLPPELLPRVFDPFVQAERTLARGRGGLGLGLALVKGLVELHGGVVAARSEGVGKGTEVHVRLPLEPAARTSDATETEPPPRVLRRVLVIEDNADAADMMREALAIEGHLVEVASTGPEGIAMARAHHPDLVFCDIGLPGLDGYDVARALRSDPALHDVPLVALSGYALPVDVERARDAGFDAHVAKPPSFSELRTIIARADGHGQKPAASS